MITGFHTIVYSDDAEATREFFRDTLDWPHLDAGGGWLIFGLPPSEMAVHPSDVNNRQEIYLMCDDVDVIIGQLAEHEIECGDVEDMGWGRLTNLTLPGGGKLGVYEPRHERPGSAPA